MNGNDDKHIHTSNFLVFAFYHKYHIKCIYSKGSFHNLLFDVYNIYYAHQISHRHTAIVVGATAILPSRDTPYVVCVCV